VSASIKKRNSGKKKERLRMIKAFKDYNLAEQAAQACPTHTALPHPALPS